jgi:predicted dienelactone hydrolase
MTTLRLAAMVLALACALSPPAQAGAGFTDLALTDPVDGGKMPVIVVYPAATEGETGIGSYRLAAARDAVATPGRYPLVVLSHGSGGTRLGHHDSLTALAEAGFIAAAIEHPRDNYRDRSGLGSDRQLYGRAAHVTAAIDGLLADPEFGPLIDPGRIGIAGFSAGGYTALVTVGARPDPSGFLTYCRAEPEDEVFCRGRSGPLPFGPPPAMQDKRLRAAFVMAPGFGFLFDRAGLADVTVPVRLYRAENDAVLRHPWNAQRIADNLPRQPEYIVINGAGHYVFLVPCAPEVAARNALICSDPPGVDRAAIHRRINDEMVDFFSRTL